MNRSHHAHPLRRKLSIVLHRWHRRIGVLASLFVIWMVISGWLLNHTGALNLSQHIVHSSLIAQRYGLQVDQPQFVFNDKSHWLVATQNEVLFDGKALTIEPMQPLGFVASNQTLFIADNAQIILLAADGSVIDKLSGAALPVSRIEKIGAGCGGVVVASGEKKFASADGIAWHSCDADVQWSHSQELTIAQRDIVAPIIQPGISLERLLLDLHSGRFLGTWGPYFIDLVGLGLLLLALSGLWMYWQHVRRRRHLHH
ncbi:MAG: PepSY protein [Verrucomicrobiaceae bacterium]|nr:PepSY protein [Verrucomicrobiaceae bacterium]